MPIDKFKEGNQGQAMGKLAGHMNESSPVIDLELGNSIQTTFVMLDYLKKNLDDLTGVTAQRKGAIDNRETKGGVELALTQSSVTTEKWFSVHDNTKLRALKAWVECAKVAWKDKKTKRPYVLDDGSQAILDFDGEVFAEYEYGIDISSSSSDMDMLNTLKSLAQPFMQNGGSMSMVMEIWRTKDPTTLQRKIETYERYARYQKHNLNRPRVYSVYTGYDNRGDLACLLGLLRRMGDMLNKEDKVDGK